MNTTMDDIKRNSRAKSRFPFFDPGRLFERIIRAWGAESVKSYFLDPAPKADLPAERKVVLTGTLQGVLVLRTSPEFLLWLRDLRQNTAMGRYNSEEIFDEMVSLYCLYLFHDFWNPEFFHIGPIRPCPSNPTDWPPYPPRAAFGLKVDGHSLEVRLWLED
jgi:hypothetical protein